MKIRPLADRVVIKKVEAEEKTQGGLILTSSAKEQPQVAEVVAVGPGTKDEPMELKVGDKVMGNKTTVKVVKNKVAPPFKEAEFDIMFGKGISREGDILDLAANCGVVIKSGSWYAYNNEKIGQGRENAKKYFMENPAVMVEVEQKVRDFYNIDGTQQEEAEQPVGEE